MRNFHKNTILQIMKTCRPAVRIMFEHAGELHAICELVLAMETAHAVRQAPFARKCIQMVLGSTRSTEIKHTTCTQHMLDHTTGHGFRTGSSIELITIEPAVTKATNALASHDHLKPPPACSEVGTSGQLQLPFATCN